MKYVNPQIQIFIFDEIKTSSVVCSSSAAETAKYDVEIKYSAMKKKVYEVENAISYN